MPLPRIIRGRRRRILLLIASGAVLFFLLQFFALKVLNMSTKRNAMKTVVDSDFNFVEDQEQVKQNVPLEKSLKVVVNNRTVPRGVHVNDGMKYQADKDNLFHCLTSKKTIPFTQVNDDYCDCEDSSDEPGTPACPDSRFYCKQQMPDRDPQYVVSNRVNDGICDCCDGSDEWNQFILPKDLRIFDDNTKRTLYHAPCEDKCVKVIHMKQENEKIRQLGRRIKKTYIQAASFISNKESYGPEGAFYKLSDSCYSFRSNEYDYTVCPFKEVKQQKFPQPSRVLGRSPQWKHMTPGNYQLQMVGGDAELCPNGWSRSTTLQFLCGINDKVIQIQEDERCSYTIKFSTPAAC